MNGQRSAPSRTQTAILTAYVELIEELGTDDVPFRLVARRSGVAERTVYRTYSTRTQLLTATATWLRETVFTRSPATSAFDLPLTVREMTQAYSAHPELAHVVAESSLRAADVDAADDVDPRPAPEPGRSPGAGVLVGEAFGHLSPRQQQRMSTALDFVDSAAHWVTLRREVQMDERDLLDAAAWAAETLLRGDRSHP